MPSNIPVLYIDGFKLTLPCPHCGEPNDGLFSTAVVNIGLYECLWCHGRFRVRKDKRTSGRLPKGAVKGF